MPIVPFIENAGKPKIDWLAFQNKYEDMIPALIQDQLSPAEIDGYFDSRIPAFLFPEKLRSLKDNVAPLHRHLGSLKDLGPCDLPPRNELEALQNCETVSLPTVVRMVLLVDEFLRLGDLVVSTHFASSSGENKFRSKKFTCCTRFISPENFRALLRQSRLSESDFKNRIDAELGILTHPSLGTMLQSGAVSKSGQRTSGFRITEMTAKAAYSVFKKSASDRGINIPPFDQVFIRNLRQEPGKGTYTHALPVGYGNVIRSIAA